MGGPLLGHVGRLRVRSRVGRPRMASVYDGLVIMGVIVTGASFGHLNLKD